MKSDLNWCQILLRPLNYNTVKNKWLLMPQISNSLQIQSVMICKIPKNLLFHNIMVMYFLFIFTVGLIPALLSCNQFYKTFLAAIENYS